MTIFSFITMMGGLAFFLYGMNVMSSSLSKIAGGKLEQMLNNMTSNPLKSISLGAGVTIAIQSSSALTVMLVGLVNSGIMEFSRTIDIILGSNIGTTLTAWILSLAGIRSDNFLLNLLKPSSFAPLFALVGIILNMMSKRQRRKDIGIIMVGFSVLMFGMELMSNAVSPLVDSPQYSGLLTTFGHPLLGILISTLFTGVIQSSAATIGILQALSITGGITYGMAIPIVLGANIGTSATAIISSIGVSRNARKVAIVHVLVKLIGVIVLLPLYLLLDRLIKFPFTGLPAGALGIALSHTIFNLLNTGLLLPFRKQLVGLSTAISRDGAEDEGYALLDERLLKSPSFAIAACVDITAKMAFASRDAVVAANSLINRFNEKTVDEIIEIEQMLDRYQDKLGTYLLKIASKALTVQDSSTVSRLLHSIGDFERIGDHAVNITDAIRKMFDKELSFTDAALAELGLLIKALEEILDIAMKAFEKNDPVLASRVEPLEQVIDTLASKVKLRHVERLQGGKCNIEMGFVFSDLLTNFERISDHCSNIAVGVIELHRSSYATHEYLRRIKDGSDKKYQDDFKHFSKKYALE